MGTRGGQSEQQDDDADEIGIEKAKLDDEEEEEEEVEVVVGKSEHDNESTMQEARNQLMQMSPWCCWPTESQSSRSTEIRAEVEKGKLY